MLQAVLVAVGDENLTKRLSRGELQELRHTTHIELIEQIIQQQDGLCPRMACQKSVLRQLERHEERLLLTLRAELTSGVLANGKQHIIAVDARGGVLIHKILLA